MNSAKRLSTLSKAQVLYSQRWASKTKMFFYNQHHELWKIMWAAFVPHMYEITPSLKVTRIPHNTFWIVLKTALRIIHFSWRQKDVPAKDISPGPTGGRRLCKVWDTCYVLPLQTLISVFISSLCNLFAFMVELTQASRLQWLNTRVPFTCLVKSSKLSYVQRFQCLWHPVAINRRVSFDSYL